VSLDIRRLLGLAFAAADLLIEVDTKGKVRVAIGAGRALVDVEDSALVGRSCLQIFDPAEEAMLAALAHGLDEGERRGPAVLRLAGEPARAARAYAFRLPGGEDVSLALAPAPLPPRIGEDGLHNTSGFEAAAHDLIAAGRVCGRELELAMVELSGLSAARARLSPADAEALTAKVAAQLRLHSQDGVGAARLGDERFALLRTQGASAKHLVGGLTRAMNRELGGGVDVQAQTMPINSQADTNRALRAMRYALDNFAQGGLRTLAQAGLKGVAPQTLAAAVDKSVSDTFNRVEALGAAVRDRRFQLAFQPVVSLKTGRAHHHEVLVRFAGEESPYESIRMAEEFDLITELDHAVVEQAVLMLKKATTPGLKLAVNVSGRTIITDAFVQHVTDLISRSENARGSLIFEITESAAIEDLPRANRQIQALRKLGSLVCLDDFGAGATSFEYLRQLSLDIVKIDGRYVRDMAEGGKDAAMVRHIAQLCADLKLRSVAEMVETQKVESVIRRLGVDFAQGFRYGLPSDAPEPPLTLSQGRYGT
jgi:EAL domain-containing protein (putative c-di-GMP-specific phosphodiesterase class I)